MALLVAGDSGLVGTKPGGGHGPPNIICVCGGITGLVGVGAVSAGVSGTDGRGRSASSALRNTPSVCATDTLDSGRDCVACQYHSGKDIVRATHRWDNSKGDLVGRHASSILSRIRRRWAPQTRCRRNDRRRTRRRGVG